MNAKLTNASEIKSTNQESDLFETNMHELTFDEISRVAGGRGEVIDPPRGPARDVIDPPR
jgi:hypothetical protein